MTTFVLIKCLGTSGFYLFSSTFHIFNMFIKKKKLLFVTPNQHKNNIMLPSPL